MVLLLLQLLPGITYTPPPPPQALLYFSLFKKKMSLQCVLSERWCFWPSTFYYYKIIVGSTRHREAHWQLLNGVIPEWARMRFFTKSLRLFKFGMSHLSGVLPVAGNVSGALGFLSCHLEMAPHIRPCCLVAQCPPRRAHSGGGGWDGAGAAGLKPAQLWVPVLLFNCFFMESVVSVLQHILYKALSI